MRRSFNFTRDFYIPKGATEVRDDKSDAVAYTYERLGVPYAVIFFGKQNKPVAHYRYRDNERRDASIREHFERNQQADEYVKNRREARKAFKHDAKVGDIYSTCWGYDQTNVEFFEIVEIKGKFAVLREIGVDVGDGGGPSQETVTPVPGRYVEPRGEHDKRGQPVRRLIQAGGIKIDEVRTATRWRGGAQRRTAFGWGH